MKLFRNLSLLAFFLGIPSVFAGDFGYPVGQIAKPSCKRQDWKDLASDCKMDLPKIAGADYSKYKTDTTYRRIYSILWGSTYDWGWDTGYGSHLGVDIATSAGTPVLSIAEGTVVSAGSMNGWGNTISIKHTLKDGTVLFSNYSHLSAVSVSKGEVVRLGSVIGAVGNTGNSYGNHLHFQIDVTDQAHPYYYFTCSKGLDPLKVVNGGLCREYLLSNTIDPIVFLETGNLSTVTPSASTIRNIQGAPIKKIDRNSIESRQKILDDEAAEYLKSFSIDIGLAVDGTNLAVGKTIGFDINVTDTKKKPVKGNLPELGIKIGFDPKLVTVFPEKIVALENGKRGLSITAKKGGTVELTFILGKTVLGKRTVYVTEKGEKLEPQNLDIRVAKTLPLGQEQDMYVVPVTKYGSFLTDAPYRSRFRVEIIKGKAKFCNVSQSKESACKPVDLAESFEFGYGDTFRGYVKWRIVALDSTPIEFRVVQIGAKSPVSATRKNIRVSAPKGLDRRNVYYDAILAGLQKAWWKTDNGYARETEKLSSEKAVEMIRRVLSYQVLKAGSSKLKKAVAISTLENFEKVAKTFPNKIWTRAEFAKLTLASLGIPENTSKQSVWYDEKWTYKAAITTLRKDYGFRWQDSFGQRYFQPDAPITVAEGLYLLEAVVK